MTPYWKAVSIALGLSATLSLTGCIELGVRLVLLPFQVAYEASRGTAADPAKLTHVGTIATGDIFPTGELYIVGNVWLDIDKQKNAWLLVKFGSPTLDNERSYLARTHVNCVGNALSVITSGTFSKEDATGLVAHKEHIPQIVVDKPSATVKSAIGRICT